MINDNIINDKTSEDYWINNLLELETQTKLWEGKVCVNDPLHYTINLDNKVFNLLREKFTGQKSSENKFLIFLTIFRILYSKYTGINEICVGTNLFINSSGSTNLFFLRSRLNSESSFLNIVKSEQKKLIEALNNKDFDPERLVDKLQLINDNYKENLTNLGFFYNKVGDINASLNEFCTSLIVKEDNESLILSIQSCSCLNKKLLKLFLLNYSHTLFYALSDSSVKIKDIDICSDDEEKLIESYCQSSINEPISETVINLFEKQRKNTPHKIAVVFKDIFLTYEELDLRSSRLMNYMTQKQNLCKGETVAVLLNRSEKISIVTLAILKAGGIFLPIDPSHPENRIIDILNDSCARLVISDRHVNKELSFIKIENIESIKVIPYRTIAQLNIKDIDSLPFPDRTLVDYDKYFKYIGVAMAKHTISVLATRGCPYNCLYCHKLWPKSHVYRSADNLYQEIQICSNAGAKRFVFVDDIFNLNKKNFCEFLKKIIKNNLDIQLFFPNMRGDILTPEIIDLMVEAGTVNMTLSLESASERIHSFIGKNLNLGKLKENIDYIINHYPEVILELQLMIGFPTETEDEATMTVEYLQGLKWVDFPNLNILKIYPNTEMEKYALEHGITHESILNSSHFAYHELPETLSFSKSFTRQLQTKYINEYFLNKERILSVLPNQLNILTEDEIIQKYDSYLPMKINSIQDILDIVGISDSELKIESFNKVDNYKALNFTTRIKEFFPSTKPVKKALKILFLDLSQLYTCDSENKLYIVSEPPLGLMYLLTYINNYFKEKVSGKIYKSGIDFDNDDSLLELIKGFSPDIIGIRTLSIYKDFFHQTVSLLKQQFPWVPIITGGPYATSDYGTILQDNNIDLAVLGEGELTLHEIVRQSIENGNRLPDYEILKTIKGIAFTSREQKDELKSQRRKIIKLEHILNDNSFDSNAMDTVKVFVSDPAFLIYTSGSTGKPKGVLQTHKCLSNVVARQIYHGDFQNELNILQFSTYSFDVFIAHELFFSLLSGGALFLSSNEERDNLSQLINNIVKNSIEWIYMPASLLNVFVDEYLELFPKYISLKHIVSAGEQLNVNQKLKDFLNKNANIHLHNFYGPSETHNATNYTLKPSEGEILREQPIGKPSINTKVYIIDENLNKVPIGVEGDVYIGGYGLAHGYLNNPELTSQKFVKINENSNELFFKSGDIAKFNGDGNIQFIGRCDNQHKIRGMRIETGEIEAKLSVYKNIKDVIVIVRKDQINSYLVAYFNSPDKIETEELKSYLKRYFPDYMIPSFFVSIDKFPLNSNGKIDKEKLPLPFIESKKIIQPSNRVEKELHRIWSEILEIELANISIEDNFFDLGGNSLKATILASKIHKTFTIRTTLNELFEKPTIKNLSILIRAKNKTIYNKLEHAGQKQYYEATPIQKRLYLYQLRNPQSKVYNLSGIYKLKTDHINIKKIEDAINGVVSRHEILRTSFHERAGKIIQEIKESLNIKVDYSINYQTNIEELSNNFIKPFDLTIAPAFRIQINEVAKKEYLLLIDFHHIIIDGVSMKLFLDEFAKIYNGKVLNQNKFQYKDFSEWFNKELLNGEVLKQKEFWGKIYEKQYTNYDLSSKNFDIGGVQSETINFNIKQNQVDFYRKLSNKENTTLFNTMLSIFCICISKISTQNDIVIGCPVSGRKREEFNEIIGSFVNLLPMRYAIEPESSFLETLKYISKTSFNYFENQEYPYELIVEMINKNEGGDRNMTHYVFSFHNEIEIKDVETIHFNDIALESYEYNRQSPRYDLNFQLFQDNDLVLCKITYDKDRFTDDAIINIKNLFQHLLSKIMENPKRKITEIDFIGRDEHDKYLSMISSSIE